MTKTVAMPTSRTGNRGVAVMQHRGLCSIILYKSWTWVDLGLIYGPFRNYFSSYETGQAVDGAKRRGGGGREHREKYLTHPQAEKGGLILGWPN